MKPFSLASFYFYFVAISLCCNLSKAQFWPRPESLIFFTPLDNENGLTNIATNTESDDIYNPLLETTKPGPFGIANSSYTVETGPFEYYIASYYPQPSFPSFTFSTYFYVSGNQQKGGIFYIYGYDNPNRVAVIYNGNALEIYRFGPTGSISIGSFTVGNFFNNGWTWICFTYDDSSKTVILYNELGKAIKTVYNFPILESSKETKIFFLGYGSTSQFMTNGDAMACTMVYNQVLEDWEVAELPKVCEYKGKNPSPLEPWPENGNLIGLWPLSTQYQLNIANQVATFKPVSVHY